VVEGLLTGTSLEAVLRDLSDKTVTGCLVIRDSQGDEAEVFLKDGQVYAVAVPGRRTMLGARLMSSGSLSPDASPMRWRSSATSCRAGGWASCSCTSATSTARSSRRSWSSSSRTRSASC
jgi:hypothetical protein